VKNSTKEGFRARSAYKLLQIFSEYPQLITDVTTSTSSANIFDLGASPGSWCQVLSKKFIKDAKIIGIDLLPLRHLENVTSVIADFSQENIIELLLNAQLITKNKYFADLVVCDLCANISGNSCIDNNNNFALWQKALNFTKLALKPKMHFLIKVFDSNEADQYFSSLRENFKQIIIFKPKASRKESSEKYFICLNKY
jgi:23S rRNA (uridine2552-2'-O)-methyltransferase